MYAYVGGDPVNFVDPCGLQTAQECLADQAAAEEGVAIVCGHVDPWADWYVLFGLPYDGMEGGQVPATFGGDAREAICNAQPGQRFRTAATAGLAAAIAAERAHRREPRYEFATAVSGDQNGAAFRTLVKGEPKLRSGEGGDVAITLYRSDQAWVHQHFMTDRTVGLSPEDRDAIKLMTVIIHSL